MKSSRLLLIGLFLTLASSAQFNMPSFKQVVTAFYSKYTFESDESYLKFQRKKEGWYVSQDRYADPGHYFNTFLFWSIQTKSFQNLDFPASNSDTSLVSESVNKYLRLIDWSYEQYQFERQKYYGYPGWDWDIISEDKEQESVSDSLLESKARAYSNYASGFIAEQYGDLFINNDSDRVARKATERISASAIKKFIFYDLKAINAFSKILEMSPGYETKVGNIKIKLANEYMFMYSDLMMAQESLNAGKFAKKADYPDSLLIQSKSFMQDLPFNSILVTSGDNDTYPLWYLQQVQKYRPDIIVLNNNLLGFRRYLALIQQTWRPAVFSTKEMIYLKNNFEYFLFSNPLAKNEGKDMDVGIFIRELRDGHNPYDPVKLYYKGDVLKKYYSKNLYFKKGNIKKPSIVRLNDYLFMNEYILLDIVNTSIKRKIFFTFANDLLAPILKQHGLVYEVEF